MKYFGIIVFERIFGLNIIIDVTFLCLLTRLPNFRIDSKLYLVYVLFGVDCWCIDYEFYAYLEQCSAGRVDVCHLSFEGNDYEQSLFLTTFTRMILHFGLRLDDNFLPYASPCRGGHKYLGPAGLLTELEAHLGLTGHPNNTDYLRIEQYRQACLQHSEDQADSPPFYAAAFTADPFAVSADLLSRRDELLLGGWDFTESADTPARLRTLAAIENCCVTEEGSRLTPGYADRFAAVERALEHRKQPFTKIYLNEPAELLPVHLLRLFTKAVGSENILQMPEATISGNSDLANFQRALTQKTAKTKLNNDGSLLILRAKRANEAAVFLARLIRDNSDYRPQVIVPERNRTLDIALVREGLPSLGIPSASLARPSLQILKLVTAFLWEPIDPYKILEFVSLSVKPLHDRVANVIAEQMAGTPGLDSDEWSNAVGRAFGELDALAQSDPALNVTAEREWFDFWFNRRRYPIDGTVFKGEVIEIFKRLKDWAYKIFDAGNGKQNSLLVLSDQARRIAELLEELPETQLSNLELERIVRTIYEPSPIIFEPTAKGHLPYTPHPSAVIGEVTDLLWWNFTQNEPVHFFSRWYQSERGYLEGFGVYLKTPRSENALLLWQRSRPVLRTRSRLILCIPEMIDGSGVQEHPLFDNLKAAFDNPDDLTYNLSTEKGRDVFEAYFSLQDKIEIAARRLGRPQPFLHIKNLHALKAAEYETYSSLNALYYYPYKWLFQYKLRLRPSSILSIVSDRALMGNLAHKMFEDMLQKDTRAWSKDRVTDFIDKNIGGLLKKQGAVLLLYGREPERLNFINKLKNAAWSLVRHLQQNGWTAKEIEQKLEGSFAEKNVTGIADLVLEKAGETAIVDLKWSGRTYRTNLIKSEEDLQMILYAELMGKNSVHTAYFIMQDAKMVARNNAAFAEADAVVPDADHRDIHARILEKMAATQKWRQKQTAAGMIEVRSTATAMDLEDYYAENEDPDVMLGILEMRDEDAKFDDYRTLINLI